MTHHTDLEIDTTNAEKELLAMHHFLTVMPGDPGPSVPMVVRMGVVIARLEENRSKQCVVEDMTNDTSLVSAVDVCATSSHPTTPTFLTNVFGLILVELEWAEPCCGMTYVATKAPFASLDEAAEFLRQHPHEDIEPNKDLTPKNVRVVMAVDECLLPSDLIAESFHVAQTDCVIGSW